MSNSENLISDRIKNLSESQTLAMTRRSRELSEQGYDVINLSIGEPDFDTPNFIKESAKEAIDKNFTHYTPVAGFPDLRSAISKKFKRDNKLNYPPNQIIVSTGAKQSLANVILSLINPGQEVLVPVPYWVTYYELIRLAEGVPVLLPTSIDNDFKVTPKQVERAISRKTKLFIFSTPCNPTGSVYTHDELAALVEVFKKHPDIYIISDEIYEHIMFEGKHESIASFEEIADRVITINGVSKGFAMTGFRIGFLGASPEIIQASDKMQGQVTSGTCSISQKAATTALLADPKQNPEIQEMIAIFKQRRDMMVELVGNLPGFRVNVPKGAFYLFPNVTKLFGAYNGTIEINNSSDLCNYLLDDAHVAVVPGEAFGDPKCIRISYAASNETLQEAVKRISESLSKLQFKY
ncbi:MAG: pyridoxal phosphate-dependent aminotransferase [Bacteroidales bacterium]|nr:pyridoxal phosphate-dependent aminotransferase [Bacteroidales bacterium]